MTDSVLTDGLWRRNPALVQLLGLCPLLAVSNTLINALAMGLATLAVLLVTNLAVSLMRGRLPAHLRIAGYVLIIATAVSALEIAMDAWFHGLYLALGIYVPIITTNCLIIGRAEACASHNPPGVALRDALGMGGGFLLALVTLGALREWLAWGTLLAGADQLFGPVARDWTLQLGPGGWLLAALPPGAFIGLGCLLAIKNGIDQRRAATSKSPSFETLPSR